MRIIFLWIDEFISRRLSYLFVVLQIKYGDFTFGDMSVPDLTLYNAISKKLGEQEAHDLVEFIHSEVRTQMQEVKSDLNTKTNVFLTKEDKIDLIDRINKVKTELIVWIVGVSLLQYILLMVTRKFF